jgi:hypothetical protein
MELSRLYWTPIEDPFYNLFHYNACIPAPKERYGSRSAK